jgi:hypothetical protein
MAKRSAFVLPDGLELELTDETISIRYDGDIRLDSTLGRDIGEIHAGGDVELKLDRVTGTICAGGTLTINSEIDATLLKGREVVLGRKRVKCRAISATERITIGAAKLTVECVIAPEINLDSKASGRVTVIESHNERGATKIRGGLALEDYDDMFGNAADFLAERGLPPLSESASPTPEDEAGLDEDDFEELDDDAIDDASEENDLEAAASAEEEATPEQEPEAKEEPAEEEEEEDDDDPLTTSLDDIEFIEEMNKSNPASANDVDDELFAALTDAVSRITSCYEGMETPPAVNELQALVEQRDFQALRGDISKVWNGLIGFHQQRGIRPHHQVAWAFNVIHELIQ